MRSFLKKYDLPYTNFMIKNIFSIKILLIFVGLFSQTLAQAQQRTESFPENQKEFLNQFYDFMTQSKTQVMEDLFKDFDIAVKKQIIVSNDPYIRQANEILIYPWRVFLEKLWAGEII